MTGLRKSVGPFRAEGVEPCHDPTTGRRNIEKKSTARFVMERASEGSSVAREDEHCGKPRRISIRD